MDAACWPGLSRLQPPRQMRGSGGIGDDERNRITRHLVILVQQAALSRGHRQRAIAPWIWTTPPDTVESGPSVQRTGECLRIAAGILTVITSHPHA